MPTFCDYSLQKKIDVGLQFSTGALALTGALLTQLDAKSYSVATAILIYLSGIVNLVAATFLSGSSASVDAAAKADRRTTVENVLGQAPAAATPHLVNEIAVLLENAPAPLPTLQVGDDEHKTLVADIANRLRQEDVAFMNTDETPHLVQNLATSIVNNGATLKSPSGVTIGFLGFHK
jgi:hypothetical protein